MKSLAYLAGAALLALAPPAVAQLPAPEAQDESQQLLAALREMVATTRAEMFAPGPEVPGWNRGGEDPDAALRRAGADDYVFMISSTDGPAVVMLTRRLIADFAPAGWQVIDSYGTSAAALANPFVQFIALTPRYVIGLRASSRREGGVDCSDPVANAILYEVPDAPASSGDEDMPIWFRIALLAAEDQVVCSRYERAGDGWVSRAFLPDGRSLPGLDDASERISIVPAAPVDELLRRAAIKPNPA